MLLWEASLTIGAHPKKSTNLYIQYTLVFLNSTFGVFHFGPIGTSDLSEH